MFEGFKPEYVDVGEVTLRVWHGGATPPVVRRHGRPRTDTTWHLAERSHPANAFVGSTGRGVAGAMATEWSAAGVQCVTSAVAD